VVGSRDYVATGIRPPRGTRRRKPCVVLIMGTAGLVAALGPARRGLPIQPTEALRDE